MPAGPVHAGGLYEWSIDPDPHLFNPGQPRGQFTQLRRPHHRLDLFVLKAQTLQALQRSVGVLRTQGSGLSVGERGAQSREGARTKHLHQVELQKALAAVLSDFAVVDPFAGHKVPRFGLCGMRAA